MTALMDQSVEDQVALAERSVLGAAMRSLSAYEKAAAVLSTEDFVSPRHQVIWNAIREVVHSMGPDRANPDLVLVGQRLIETGRMKDAGDLGYLAPLFAEVATVKNAGYYARAVKAAAQQRALGFLGNRLARAAATGMAADERAALVAEAMAELGDVAADPTVADPTPTLQASTLALLDTLEGVGPASLTTGIGELDELLGGMAPGQVIVVGARPAVGKSILGLQVATHVARDLGRPALVFSLEMTAVELEARALCAAAEVPSSRLNLQRPALTEEDWSRLADALDDVAGIPLHVVTEQGLTIERISALADAFHRSHRDLGLVVIDYLGLVRTARPNATPYERTSEISRAVKVLAGRLGCPVLLVAQLNRESTRRDGRVPQLADFRDSGAVEQDADVVILLHREDQIDPESPRAGEVDLIVAKHRGGPTGVVSMAAQLHYFRFATMAA